MSEATQRARSLVLVVLAEVCAISLWLSGSAVAPELAREWSLSPSATTWLTSSTQLGFVVGALGAAVTNLADRVAAHRLFAMSAVLGAAFTAAIPAWAESGEVAILLRFATGVTMAGVYPPGMKLVASWTTRHRGLAVGTLVAAVSMGSAMPHLLGALALTEGGDASTGPTDWRAVLYGAAALALLGSVCVAAFVRPGPALARSAPFDWHFALRPFAERPQRLANLGYLGHMWELYAVWTWIPFFLAQSYQLAGHSASAARFAAFSVIAMGSVGSFVAGALADRFGRTTVAGTSLAISGTCCLVAGFLFDAPLLLTGLCLVWGFAVVADSAQFSAAVSELADPRYVGTALAIQTSTGFLLTLGSIRLVPILAEHFGWEVAWASLAIGPAVGTWAMVALRRSPEAVKLASGRG